MPVFQLFTGQPTAVNTISILEDQPYSTQDVLDVEAPAQQPPQAPEDQDSGLDVVYRVASLVEELLPVFESTYPEEGAARRAVKAARLWSMVPSVENKQAAYEAHLRAKCGFGSVVTGLGTPALLTGAAAAWVFVDPRRALGYAISALATEGSSAEHVVADSARKALEWALQQGPSYPSLGKFSLRGKGIRAHQMSLRLSGTEIPPGAFVCHTCDTPACVNPDHLYVGDAQTNATDAVTRGRTARGRRCHTAKLSQEDVMAIRELHKAGATGGEIAERFGVDQTNVSSICRRKSWKHVPGGGRTGKHGTSGSANVNAKLSTADVINARWLRDSGMTLKALADLFGVSVQSMWMLASGRSYVS